MVGLITAMVFNMVSAESLVPNASFSAAFMEA